MYFSYKLQNACVTTQCNIYVSTRVACVTDVQGTGASELQVISKYPYLELYNINVQL